MSAGEGRVADWLVERLAAGELSGPEAAAVRERLAREEGGLQRLEALLASNAEILKAHPAADVVAEIKRRRRVAEAARAGRGVRVSLLLLPALGAAALLVLYAGPRFHPGSTAAGDEYGERIKGSVAGPRLRVYRKEGDRARPLSEGALVRPRDTLQVAYLAGGRAYGAVVSLDGHGVVTLHLPEQGGEAARLTGSGEVPLPHSYELDSAPGFERFVFVTAGRPFGVAEIARALREGRPLPAGFDQAVFNVRKESSR